MQLYFAPLACSMATRIALAEANADADFIQVNTKLHRLVGDNSSYYDVNPLGQVPALRTDDGTLITENGAILEFVGEKYPQSGLIPDGMLERAEMRKWLSFTGTELHKGVYAPLFDPGSPEAMKLYVRDKMGSRFDVLERHLADGRPFLLGTTYSLADIYLAVVLTWSSSVGIELRQYVALHAWHQKLLQRAHVADALRYELGLYQAEKRKAADAAKQA